MEVDVGAMRGTWGHSFKVAGFTCAMIEAGRLYVFKATSVALVSYPAHLTICPALQSPVTTWHRAPAAVRTKKE